MHSHDELMQTIGKATIVRSIIEAERGSELFFDQNNSRNKLVLEKLEGSWFMKFIRVLGRGITKGNPERRTGMRIVLDAPEDAFVDLGQADIDLVPGIF